MFEGDSYKFRIRAINEHGPSEWSNPVQILPTGVPDKPDYPTTVINNQNIKITWVDPGHNSEAIDGYNILIYHKDGINYSEQTYYCDGLDS